MLLTDALAGCTRLIAGLRVPVADLAGATQHQRFEVGDGVEAAVHDVASLDPGRPQPHDLRQARPHAMDFGDIFLAGLRLYVSAYK